MSQPPGTPYGGYTAPQPYQPMPPQQPVRKSKRFGWVALIITAMGSWFIGLMFGIAGSGDPTATTAAPEATTTVTETAAAEPNPEPTTAPEPKKTAPPPKTAATIDEGTYQIGVDAPAGRYKTVAEDSCYWQRAKDDSGSLDSILANDNVNDGARASVTVKKGEFFTSEGCGTWTKV